MFCVPMRFFVVSVPYRTICLAPPGDCELCLTCWSLGWLCRLTVEVPCGRPRVADTLIFMYAPFRHPSRTAGGTQSFRIVLCEADAQG